MSLTAKVVATIPTNLTEGMKLVRENIYACGDGKMLERR